MHIAAPTKLAIVEYGTILGSTNYGIINQTIGPRVNPNIPIYKNSATTTNTFGPIL
jgi:hypothetical protein